MPLPKPATPLADVDFDNDSEAVVDAPETSEEVTEETTTDTVEPETEEAAPAPKSKKKKPAPAKDEKKTAPKPKAKRLKKLKTSDPSGGRKPIYDDVESRVFQGDEPLTVAAAKELLGWEEGTDEAPLDADSTSLKDRNGESVLCANTTMHQRPFARRNVETIMWDILKGNWELNGEVFSIGKHGWVLNGKTRLAALVFAAQEFERNSARYPAWEAEPTLDIVGIFGVEESDRVVRTIDTGAPRSLAQSIYSSGVFGKLTKGELMKVSRMLDFALREVRDRTGADDYAYSPSASHSDFFEFLELHPTMIQLVKSVFDEEGDERRLSRMVSPGMMAGLLYLMAASGSDGEAYHESVEPSEKWVDFKTRDQAEEFLTLLAGDEAGFKPVVDAIAKLAEEGNTQSAFRRAIIIKAWNVWSVGKPITAASIKLKTEVNEEGVLQLVEFPVISSGIDRGPA